MENYIQYLVIIYNGKEYYNGKDCIPCIVQYLPVAYFIIFFFLGLHLRHIENPRLEAESELHLQPIPQLSAMLDP